MKLNLDAGAETFAKLWWGPGVYENMGAQQRKEFQAALKSAFEKATN